MSFVESPAAPVSEGDAGCPATLAALNVQTLVPPQPPQEMQQAPRWGLWRIEIRDGKPTKVPYSVRSGRRANVNNPGDWTNYPDALAMFKAGGFEGLGFALGPDGTGNYWQGIDLDKISANQLDGLAAILPGYVELSPSRAGLHAIGYGQPFRPFKHFGVEAYSEKRFFTFTGQKLRGNVSDLAPFYEANIEPHRPTAASDTPNSMAADSGQSLRDDEIVASLWTHPTLAALYQGDLSAYGGDHSRADQALVNAIAARSRNRAQTERLWAASPMANIQGRQSKMRRRGYLDSTIDKAFKFEPPLRSVDLSGVLANGKPFTTGVITNNTPWISAGDLRNKHFEQTMWIVPRIIPQGLTIFGGRPKLGKSWAALSIAIAVAEGGEAFGQQCEPGDVLYGALEDTQRRLKNRMWKLKGSEAWPASLNFLCDLPRADEGGVALVRDWLEQARNPRLLIIDTLAKVRPNKARDEGSYDADYRAVTPWKALADEFDVSVVLIHHVRKLVAEDPLEMISGTNGLTGAADAILILNRSSQGCTLGGRGRDLEEFELAVGFNSETCRWAVLGNAVDVQRSSERSSILGLLARNTEALSPKQIAGQLNMSDDAVRQLLLRMTQAGEVVKPARGLYSFPCHNSHNTDPLENVTLVTPGLTGAAEWP